LRGRRIFCIISNRIEKEDTVDRTEEIYGCISIINSKRIIGIEESF
jgi:hypothetical protein